VTEHAVVIAGGGPTGLMLAAELALAKVDVAIVQRRTSQDVEGSRSGGLHARTLEVSRFTDMTRQAASYRERRVLLAGDAATCIHRLVDRPSTPVCRMR
jgi:2-polyprenyl-6-methoxyphenol hydroxylase-like FAD-dependent oxidoreductase